MSALIEYIKKLFKKWVIYLAVLPNIYDYLSAYFNIEYGLPSSLITIFVIFIFMIASFSVWKDERDEKVRLYLIVNGEVPNLSAEAEELLKDTAKSSKRKITELRTHSGFSIQIDKKSYALNQDPRIVAKYKNALVELIDNGFIDEKKGDFYEIKEKGYKYLEERS